MSDMIERVARAIGETVPGRSETITPWTLVAARAAIEAMREPTPGMILAGARSTVEWADATPRSVWAGMTSAALKPEVQP